MAEYDNPELLPLNSRLNTPTFSSLAQARGGDGFTKLGSELGTALFGGGARDARAEQVFQQSAGKSATVAEAMLKANQIRDMQIGRQAAAQALDDKGDAEGASIIRNSPNAASAQQALSARQKTQNIGDVMTEARGDSPDLNRLNRELMVMHGQPVQLTKIEDQNELNPYVTPDSQTVKPTDIGAAMIGTQKARASELGALAGEHSAQAAKAASGPAADASTFAPQEGDLLAAMAERGVSIPAGLRSKQQIHTTLSSLLSRNPDKGPDDIADMIRTGQLDLAGSKKETTTAAGVAGRVAIAQNEIGTFSPLVRQASAAVPRGSFMPVNRLMQMANTQISDPKLLQLKIGINSMLNAYDMLAARGGTDVAKRAEAHSLLTSAQSPEALEAGLQMFEKEAQAAGQAADKAMHKGGGSLGSVMGGDQPTAAPQQTKVIGGKTYVNHDGQWYEQ